MRARIAAIAVMLGFLSTALCWATVQPSLRVLLAAARAPGIPDSVRELATRIQAVLPFYLALDLLGVTALAYLVLQLTVGRPLAATEQAIRRLGTFESEFPIDSGGPLLSRLQASVRRAAEALRQEQEITRRQVSDLQQANDKLSRAQTELVSSDRLATLGKLAAGVAHEVGNPLSGILGYLSLARTRAKHDPEQLELLKLTEGEVGRIDQIVRSLLELGRPSRHGLGPVDLPAVVRSSLKLLKGGSEFRQVTFEEDLGDGLVAIAEQGPLSQVLINLVLNAAQAMGGTGIVEVRARAVAPASIELAVRDHGPGLTPEVAARLFEPFMTTKAAGKGTGLGLAVSRHLVETMGGTLTAANHPERGAVFVLTLKAA